MSDKLCTKLYPEECVHRSPARHVTQDELDDMVIDYHLLRASQVNNWGPRNQLDWLRKQGELHEDVVLPDGELVPGKPGAAGRA
jgi:hypothetical protein